MIYHERTTFSHTWELELENTSWSPHHFLCISLFCGARFLHIAKFFKNTKYNPSTCITLVHLIAWIRKCGMCTSVLYAAVTRMFGIVLRCGTNTKHWFMCSFKLPSLPISWVKFPIDWTKVNRSIPYVQGDMVTYSCMTAINKITHILKPKSKFWYMLSNFHSGLEKCLFPWKTG